MMRSMFAGVSGLRSHQLMMDVVGDNIANVNTPGFKGSRVLFQDTMSQLLQGAAGGNAMQGGVNPQQVGLGVRVAGIDMINTQGTIQNTGRATDVAIQGDGFFVVRSGGEDLYTRAGAFSFDTAGKLTDPTGLLAQGWLADPTTGAITTTGPRTDIKLPIGQSIPPQATQNVSVGGNLSSDAPVGTSVSTAIDVFDSLGEAHRISFEYVKTANNTWQLTTKDENGSPLVARSGSNPTTVTFDSQGAMTGPNPAPTYDVTSARGGVATFASHFGTPGDPNGLTQYGGTSSVTATGQDGSPTGYLRSFSISSDGTVNGTFSNGQTKALAQLAMATFSNPEGLVKAGASHLRASANSGMPNVGLPGSPGKGSLTAGGLEMSNVELAQEFTNLIIAQRGFQANSRIISASDELLQDLVNLKR